MPKIITQIILLLCWLMASCRDPNHIIVAKNIISPVELTRVVSGQTIEVIIPQQDNPQRVRIIGIDSPKLENSKGNEEAKNRLQELISNRDLSLELETNELDRYNRLLAHVWQDNILISEQLAKEGYVIANAEYPHQYSDRIFYAQEYARILGYGIWKSH